MLILPAIDIIDGQCVRLTQGDYDQSKVYFEEPSEVARMFERAGAKFLHVVDLDGAKLGRPMNLAVIKRIKNAGNLSLQVGGGIRSLEDADSLLALGVDRVILGTAAVADKVLVQELIEKYGAERILIGVDAKGEKVLVEGWRKDGGALLSNFLVELKESGVRTIVFTDIERDGMMKGVRVDNVQRVLASGLNVIVAGGVSRRQDLIDLKGLGVDGAIIGKAFYEGLMDPAEVVKEFQLNNLQKRVIACMDVNDGRVVKGTCFRDLQDAGDGVLLAEQYCREGADELVFLDVTATVEKRKALVELVSRVAKVINIPLTVGGGVGSIEDMRNLLNNGADKVSIGSAAVRRPQLVAEAAKAFGSQCVVISVDAKRVGESWNVFIESGRIDSGLDVREFVVEMEKLGAGELLVNSLDRDGTGAGYDLELLRMVRRLVRVPVIASSGAGCLEDFREVFRETGVDAVLAAGVFHSGKVKIGQLKQFLYES